MTKSDRSYGSGPKFFNKNSLKQQKPNPYYLIPPMVHTHLIKDQVAMMDLLMANDLFYFPFTIIVKLSVKNVMCIMRKIFKSKHKFESSMVQWLYDRILKLLLL